MKVNTRYAVLGLVFVLSTLFFWGMINRYLMPSRAQQATNMNVFISDDNNEILCHPQGVCVAYIHGGIAETEGLAGVQGIIRHSENVEIINLFQDSVCKSTSFNLNQQLVFNNESSSSASFALGTVNSTAQLAGGVKCITAVLIKPVDGVVSGTGGMIKLADSPDWKAGGTQRFNVEANTTEITINITDSAPIPTITIEPTSPIISSIPTISEPAPTSDVCSKKTKGDCNCDGKVTLPDWEDMRKAANNEGGMCDVNYDGVTNALDFSIWIQNNENMPGISNPNMTPIPTPAGKGTIMPTGDQGVPPVTDIIHVTEPPVVSPAPAD